MSASTVSITANPASTRRRPVVVTDKKSPSANNMVPTEPQTNGAADANVMAATSRDLSHHSIRGDAVLERTSKDLIHAKKTTSSTISPRRARKAASTGARKVEKSRLATVVSVFTKNFVLLMVLIGLVQMFRKLAVKSGDVDDYIVGTQLGLSEFEGRIADMKSSLKTTAKMIQLQVEVVDKKIENEVGGVRREMNKKIDEKGILLENEIKKLTEKSDGLEKRIGELKAGDWLSKEDFQKFYQQFKKGKGGELGGSDVSLDDIRVYAREIVEKEIEKHAADGLGRVDYALAAGGSMVVKHSDPYLTGKGKVNWFLNGRGAHPDADKMLTPSFGEPGQCFALKGDSGFVQIRLRSAIVPEAVTLEHVAKSVAYDRSTAPKDCRVSGWLHGGDADFAVDTEKMFLLSEFAYDLEKSSAQTFNVLDSAASGLVNTVRLDFNSNHGNPSLTCIYRLRVHGYEPVAASMMAMQH